MTHPHDPSRRTLLAAALASAGPLLFADRLLAQAAEPADNHAMPPELKGGSERIAILVYPQFTALDAVGPQYGLAGMIGATVGFVAKSREPVPVEGAGDTGLCVRPQWTFDDCPDDLDLLLVPGGLVGTIAAIEDDATRNFVADRGGRAKLAGSVCTGSLILGAAGLLEGRRATSHWQTLDLLTEVGATPVRERIVVDGDVVTAAGVSAGIDLGLTLVQRYRGDFYAKGMQLLGEYDPQPPFLGGGNPQTADPQVRAMLNAMHEPAVEQFRAALHVSRP